MYEVDCPDEGYVCIAWSVYVGAKRYEMRFWPM